MKHIPFNDLSRYVHSIQAELSAAFQRVVDRGSFVLGAECQAFENEFAAYCGTTACIGVANGTEAIELALRALGTQANDVIATVANAGGYSTTAIRAISAVPHYLEIEPATMLMCPAAFEQAAKNNRIKGVIVTHLYGQMADMNAFFSIARQHGIFVIEDCAQSHGAILQDKRAGSWGDAAAFSFYPTKNLGAMGDGGAVTTSRTDVASALRELRQYGWRQKYHSERSGGRNSRLDEMQSAFLRIMLPDLDRRNDRRRSIMQKYNDYLQGQSIILPRVCLSHAGHLYVVQHNQRDIMKLELSSLGIGSDIHYPIPDHLQKANASRQTLTPSLPITEGIANSILSLPCFPELSDQEVEAVCQGVLKVLLSLRH